MRPAGGPARAAGFLAAALLLPACGGGGGGATTAPSLGVSPAEARVGTEIVIQGPGFGAAQGASTVSVGGAPATVTSWSDTEVRALVPAAALSGVVQLVVSGVPVNPGTIVILWPQFNPVNVPVTAAASDQELQEIVTDGTGGCIVVWRDLRNGNFDVYAQRMSTAGTALWTAGGVAVCTEASAQDYPQVAPDGAGGAYVVWQDVRAGVLDIYAQRVNASGVAQWTGDGIPVCTAADTQDFVQMIPTGAGGSILAWEDRRFGASNADIFAQRLDGSGAAQWTADGLAVCLAAGNQTHVQLVPDGSGGAVLAWEDLRNFGYDVFIQRLDAAGAALWTVDGVAVSTASGNQQDTRIVPDGSGGAVVTWRDARAGVDLYGQKVTGSGQQ